MKRVAIFRSQLLALSETFIRDQALALGDWQPVLMGCWEIAGGLATPGLPREIVPPVNGRLAEKVRFWLELPQPRLVRRFRELGIDLVHAHFGVDATDVWPSVRAAGLPLVVTLHGYDINIRREWWQAGNAGLRRRVYPWRLLRMARHPSVRFVAVSRAIRQRAIAFGIPAEKVTVAYTGVDTGRFVPGGVPLEERRNRVLFVGRMIENKSPEVLVRAFAAVRARVPDAELVMIGDGPLLEATRQVARDCAVPVEFQGRRSGDDVLRELHRAKVLCLPSREVASGASEGLGQVLLEAQACGVPVIGARTGGIPEALADGETGRLFPPLDQSSLEAALLEVLQAPPERLAVMSREARRLVHDSFDLMGCARQLEHIYDEHAERSAAV